MKRGFTMFEVLLVVGLAAIIFVVGAPIGISFYRTQIIEEVRSNIIDALQRAKHYAILQKGDSAYGVHVVAGSYVIFQGATYASRDTSLDEVFPVIDSVTFAGRADIIFTKMTGVPNATGTIAINYGSLSRGIMTSEMGVISKIDIVDGVQVITPTTAVFFDANGGTGSMSPQSINVYTSANLNSNTFTRTNYVFTGWALTADGEVVYANNASYAVNTADVTLYAHWITVPGAPTIGTAATSTGGQATITFTPPASDGGSPITTYTAVSSPSGFTGMNTVSPIIVTGLTNGTAYTFTITVTNVVGTSANSATSNSVTPMPIPTGSLVSYWPLDGNANDAWSSNNGTVVGAIATSGVRGLANTAYYFDGGGTKYISLGNSTTNPSLNFTGEFTVSAWVNYAGGRSINAMTTIYSSQYYYSGDSGWSFHIKDTSATTGVLEFNAGHNTIIGTGINNIPLNTWVYVSMTRATNNRIILYINGAVDATRDLNPNYVITSTSSIAHRIGMRSVQQDNDDFNGKIDQVRVYNRVLSPSEISDIYNAEKPVVPDAPTIGTATVGNAQATVTFTAPVSNGGAVIDYYTAVSSPGGITSATTSATSAIVSGLTKGTAYTFQIYAHNSVGTSTPSNASNSATPVDTLYWVGGTSSWNTATNWSQSSGGAGNGWVPTASDNVIFNGGNVSNCTLGTNVTIQSLNVSTGYTGILDFATYNVTGGTAGDITLNIGTGGEIKLGTGTITVDGNFDWSSAAGTITGGTSTVVMTGTGKNLTTPAYAPLYPAVYKLTIAPGASITVPNNGVIVTGNVVVNGTISVSAGKILLTKYSNLTIGATGIITGAGTYQFDYTGTFTVTAGGQITVSKFLVTRPSMGGGSGGSPTIPGGVTFSNTFEIQSAGAYTFTAGAGTITCGELIIDTTGAGTLNVANNTNNPSFVVTGNVTLTQSGGTITYTKGTGTITLSGTAAQTVNLAGKTVEGIIVNKPTSGAVTWTSGDTITAGGAWSMVNLTVPAGVIIDTSANNYAVTLSGNFDQSSITSKFLAHGSTITVNGNGTFTADGTLDSTQYNSASLVLNGTNTLTYNNFSSATSCGFGNLTVGQSGNTTTFNNVSFNLPGVLTVGSGTYINTGTIYLRNNTPLSFDANSHIAVGLLDFVGGVNQTIPTIVNGYDSNIDVGTTITTVTQTGNITLNTTKFVHIDGNAVLGRAATWKTDGYNLTVGGALTIGNNNDTGLIKLDATHNGARTSTITVGGNWLNYGTGTASSTFVADNSTVIFNSTATGKTITSGATNSPFNNVQFNGIGGGWTLQDNLVATSTTLTAGNLIDNAKTVTVNGNILIANTSGLLTSTGSWIQGASGNISNPNNGSSFKTLTIAGSGVTTTLTGDVNVGRGVTGGGSITMGPGTLTGAYTLNITPSINDAITVNSLAAGSQISMLYILPNKSSYTQKAITLPDNFVTSAVQIDTVWNSITATGDWNFGNNTFGVNDETAAMPTHYVDMSSSTLTAGAVRLPNGTSSYLKMGSSAYNSVVSIAKSGNVYNKLDLGTGTTSVSGNIDFTSITVIPGSSTVVMTATTTGKTITSGTTTPSFYNLIFNGTGGVWTLQDPLVVSGNLTLTAGTLDTKNAVNNAVTLAGSFSQATTAKFTARSSTITVNGNGTFTADGTVDELQYNSATLVLNGTNTLTYNNLATSYNNGFNNLTVGQSSNISTLASTLTVRNVLSVGSGTLTGASASIYLSGSVSAPLSVDTTNSIISIGGNLIFFRGGAVTVPALSHGYDCNIIIGNTNTVATQGGDIIINGAKSLNVGNPSENAAYLATWKTDGYNLTVGGILQIGTGANSGLMKLDATHNGTRTSTITVGGNWLNYGTGTAPSQFVADDSTVIMNSTATGKTVTAGGSSFNNLTFNGSGGGWTLQDNLVANNFTMTLGTLAGNSKTITVGAGGFLYTAGTVSGVLNMIVSATTTTGAWATEAGRLANLTINNGVTLTPSGGIYANTFTITGNIGLSNNGLIWFVNSNNGFVQTGTVDSPISVYFGYFPTTDFSNGAITIGSNKGCSIYGSNAHTLTLPSWNNGTGSLSISPNTDNSWQGLTVSGAFTTGNLTLGYTGGTNRSAHLTLGTSASISSIVRAGTTTGNQLNLGSGNVTVSGNIDFTGISVTPGTSTVVLTKTSSGGTITSAGNSFKNLTQNGAGGTYTLQDNLIATGDVLLTAGTLSPGGRNITTTGNLTISDGALITASGLVSTIYYNQVTVSGTISPDATGTYTYAGTYGGLPYWRRGSDNWYVWYYSTGPWWYVSDAVGSFGVRWSDASTVLTSPMIYPGGGATGTATVANVTASGFIDPTITVGGNFSASGHSGALLTLNPASLWYLNVAGTAVANYVNAAYSNASGGTAVTPTNSTNSGNNTNWNFAPNAPTSVTAATSTGGQATITYTAPADGGSPITYYTVTSSPSSISTTTASTTAIVTGLTNGVAYNFTVTATNAIGTSSASSASDFVIPSLIPTAGLISYWSFDGNANDNFGANNGTVNGATLATGTKALPNTAYSFDGSSQYINIGDISSLEMTSQFSISSWINPTDVSNYRQIVSKFGTSGQYAYQYGLAPTGKLREDISGDGTTYEPLTTPTAPLSNNNWSHVVFTFNAGALRLYVDGQSAGSGTAGITSIYSAGTSNLNIGRSPSPQQYFKGSIDQVRIYNRALSASEVADIYKAEKPWYDNLWGYRTKITIDHNKVASSTGTLLTSFPVLISTTSLAYKSVSNGGHVAQTDGGDILFTAGDGMTLLDHEIETYAPASGNLIAWVEVPTVSTTTDTDIYMYYGNALSTDYWNVAGTWNSGYKGVWHLTDAGNSTSTDSTSNGNSGTNYVVTATSSGKVGGAGSFNGSSSYVQTPAFQSQSTAKSICAWVNPPTQTYLRGVAIQEKGFYLRLNDMKLESRVFNSVGNTSDSYNSSSTLPTDQWSYICESIDATTASPITLNYYINGNLDFSTSTNITGPNVGQSGSNYMKIGNDDDAGGRFFSGRIDEVRLSSVIRNIDWIKTEYNNESSPNTFYTIASEVAY